MVQEYANSLLPVIENQGHKSQSGRSGCGINALNCRTLRGNDRRARNIRDFSVALWCNSCSILALMPTMQRFPDCRILMYLGDHPPPHVHVVLRDGRDAIVEIESLLVIGKLAGREIRDALNWIAAQKAFLLNEWRRYNP